MNLCLSHLQKRWKIPLLERMDYWYQLEQDPWREADCVPCSHWSPLAAGRQETRLWSPQGEKRMLTGTSTSCVSILIPATRTHFWVTDSLCLYFIFKYSHTVSACIFLRAAWITLHESQCNGSVATFIFISARRMKEYVSRSDLQIFVLFFSVQLSN